MPPSSTPCSWTLVIESPPLLLAALVADRIQDLQGTYLGIYVGARCGFWHGQGQDACGFCLSGKNVGGEEETLEKTVEFYTLYQKYSF